MYLTGSAVSQDFPVTPTAFQPNRAPVPALDAPSGSRRAWIHEDAFFSVIDTSKPGLASLSYSTYLGGSGRDYATAVAVDPLGSAYVVGSTQPRGSYLQNLGSLPGVPFPTTLNAHDTSQPADVIKSFLTKFDPDVGGAASVVYSSVLGGSVDQGIGTAARAVAVSQIGEAVVVGDTRQPDFPVTEAAYDGQCSCSSPDDPDVFVVRFNNSGTDLLYSTFLGGGAPDFGRSVALGVLDKIYVGGSSASGDFPSSQYPKARPESGDKDGFVAVLGTALPPDRQLDWSTFYGGELDDEVLGMALAPGGGLVVAGSTNSSDFKTTRAAQGALGGAGDAFIAGFAFVPPGPPEPPLNLTAKSGDGRIDLSWKAPDNDGGLPVTGYKLYRRSPGGPSAEAPIASTPS
ncbi:MAG: SBBP repeat-containing protein, partial [Actinomycetota bacterium]